MHRLLENWAKQNDMEVEFWLGSGDFGEAYMTSTGQVLKITSDLGEFMAAFTLQGTKSDYLVDIDRAELTDDDHLIILMEEVDTEGVEDVFGEAMSLVEEYAFGSWEYFDQDELPDDVFISDKALQLIDDIHSSIMDLRSKGIDLPDINPGNIGIKKDRFVLFDYQMTENRSFDDFKAFIRDQQSKRQKAAQHNAQPFSLSMS